MVREGQGGVLAGSGKLYPQTPGAILAMILCEKTATFRPKGLWGRLYWSSLLPVHAFLFQGMARNIVGFRP